MNYNSLFDLFNNDIEYRIIDSIDEVEKELKGLTKECTCMIYSSYITRKLRDKHVINRCINTKDLGYSYEHQFNLVPFDDKNYYLIDLCFEQFHKDDFDSLKQDGYIVVNDSLFRKYMNIDGKDKKDIDLFEVFNGKDIDNFYIK